MKEFILETNNVKININTETIVVNNITIKFFNDNINYMTNNYAYDNELPVNFETIISDELISIGDTITVECENEINVIYTAMEQVDYTSTEPVIMQDL